MGHVWHSSKQYGPITTLSIWSIFVQGRLLYGHFGGQVWLYSHDTGILVLHQVYDMTLFIAICFKLSYCVFNCCTSTWRSLGEEIVWLQFNYPVNLWHGAKTFRVISAFRQIQTSSWRLLPIVRPLIAPPPLENLEPPLCFDIRIYSAIQQMIWKRAKGRKKEKAGVRNGRIDKDNGGWTKRSEENRREERRQERQREQKR